MKTFFGKNKYGESVSLYTIENERIIMKVMDYGAALVSLIEKQTGIDCVIGFDDMEGYLQQTSYIGASIGRTANRIESGRFSLDGKSYQIPINNNGNANHGGLEGFDKKMYECEEGADYIRFHRISPAGEEGYPGNLDVTITYYLLPDGIAIESAGISDEDTLFAYTNHSYFNLDGSDNAMTHQVRINADTYALSDENGLTKEEFVSVAGTPFDFREFKALARDIDADDIQLTYGKGYDHHFVIPGEGMREMAVCRGEKLELTISSDFAGMHLYTGNWLDHIKGKYGRQYDERCAVAFESEYMPNAINYSDHIAKPVAYKGKPLKHTMKFTLKVM